MIYTFNLAFASAIAALAASVGLLSVSALTSQTESKSERYEYVSSLTDGLVPGESVKRLDSRGFPVYAVATCPFGKPGNTSGNPSSINSGLVAFMVISGGGKPDISKETKSRILNEDGSFKNLATSSYCPYKHELLAGTETRTGLQALYNSADEVVLISYDDFLNTSGGPLAAKTPPLLSSYFSPMSYSDVTKMSRPTDGQLIWAATDYSKWPANYTAWGSRGGGAVGSNLSYWDEAAGKWKPVSPSAAAQVRIPCSVGWVYVPPTLKDASTVDSAFCVTPGEVFVPNLSEAPVLNPELLTGGTATPQLLASSVIKVGPQDTVAPFQPSPTLATYEQAQAVCSQMAPGGKVLEASQLFALRSQLSGLGQGYSPVVSGSMQGQPPSPCKSAAPSGYKVCAVPGSVENPAAFKDSPQRRYALTPLGARVWDLNGNLAEWVWSGDAGQEGAPALLHRSGLAYLESGGALSASNLTAMDLAEVSPMSKAGFRCAYRVG